MGVELKVGDHLMNNIQKDYPTDCETCCAKLLIEWLDSTPSASWDSLITAVDRLPPCESYGMYSSTKWNHIIHYLNQAHVHIWMAAVSWFPEFVSIKPVFQINNHTVR